MARKVSDGQRQKETRKRRKKARIKGDKGGIGSAKKPEPKPLTGVEVYSKPGLMQPLFAGFREGDVAADIIRPRMLTESVENGRGRGNILNFTFRKFSGRPKAVFFIDWPA